MSPARRRPGIRVRDFRAITGSIAGQNESWWGTADVHVKRADPDCPHLLANELVAMRLAAALGLPVLPGEVAVGPDGARCWATPQVQDSGQQPPPGDLAALALSDPDRVAGVFVFDVWVNNNDRHDDNIIYEPTLGLWLIDHEDTLAGRGPWADDALALAVGTPLRYHVLADAVLDDTAVGRWTQRVRALPGPVILNAVGEAVERGLLPRSERSAVSRFLRDRSGSLASLVSRSRAATPPPSPEPGQLGGAP